MRVLHIIGSISRQGGGPSRSSQGLVAGLRAAGIDAWLMTLNHGEEPWIKGCEQFVNGGSFEDALEKVRPDIVHLHGIWQTGLHRCAVVCRKRGIPYVIAPRGMLEPWSLKQKWLKKRVAMFLYQDRDLKKAAALHATAESEAEQFRRLGFKNYVIVSPNGVNVPDEDKLKLKVGVGEWNGLDSCCGISHGEHLGGLFDVVVRLDEYGNANANMTEVAFEVCTKHGQKKLPQLVSLTEAIRTVVSRQTATGTYPPNKSSVAFPTDENKGRALFVSRMHPKKGVLELVESWARVFGGSREEGVGGKEANWQCELVYTLNGDTEREYEQRIKQRILELGMAYQDKDGTNYSSTSTLNFNFSSPDFIFTGPLDDDAKWEAYGRADLFVLPTYSENFGIVVAEALWAGVPVITTKGTPWSEVEGGRLKGEGARSEVEGGRVKFEQWRALKSYCKGRCGWWIELPKKKVGGESRWTVDWPALDQALREATQLFDLRPSTFNLMRQNGHRLVEEKYTWRAVVGAMVHGYEQVLKR